VSERSVFLLAIGCFGGFCQKGIVRRTVPIVGAAGQVVGFRMYRIPGDPSQTRGDSPGTDVFVKQADPHSPGTAISMVITGNSA
jgi:hypothetical protein